MSETPTFRIDGAAFTDLSGFYDEVEHQLLGDEPWGRNLDALNDVLNGGFGQLPEKFRLVWEHADLSRRNLDAKGDASFAHLLDLIAEHPNVELVLS